MGQNPLPGFSGPLAPPTKNFQLIGRSSIGFRLFQCERTIMKLTTKLASTLLRSVFGTAMFLMMTNCLLASDVTDNRATIHVFPQFANGQVSDGSYYRSTIMVATESRPVNCNIVLAGMTYPGFGPNGSGGGFSIAPSGGFF